MQRVTVRQSPTAHQAAKPLNGRKVSYKFRSHFMPDEDKEEINRKSGLAYAAAFSLFACVIAGLVLGWLLDRWLGTRPWLLVLGLILGAAAGFYEFIRASSKLS